MVRLTVRPDMTLDVYRGRKTTIQQQHDNADMLPKDVDKMANSVDSDQTAH